MAQSSAIKVFPEAVGLASRMFWPVSPPFRMHSSWGGNSSHMPTPARTSLTESCTDNSAIFKGFRRIILIVVSMLCGFIRVF